MDFGLAQRVCAPPLPAPAPPSSPAPPPGSAAERARGQPRGVGLARAVPEDHAPAAKRSALDLSPGVRGTPAPTPAAAEVGRNSSRPDSRRAFISLYFSSQQSPASAALSRCVKSTASGPEELRKRERVRGSGEPAATLRGRPSQSGACACAGLGGACATCLSLAQVRAPRAGTQGFRPPEVLLKVPAQTTAVDVWAAGVVLISVLSARYPFFRAPSDCAALAELIDLLGTRPLQRAAQALGEPRPGPDSSPRRPL